MAQSFNSNLTNVATRYLQMLNVKVTKTSFKEALKQNPFYPSLYSINKTFEKFNIQSCAFNITKSDIEKFEPPFIAYHLNNTTGKDFVLVTGFNSSTVSYISSRKKAILESKESFLNNFQDAVLVAEANTKSGENGYREKLKEENSKRIKQNFLSVSAGAILALLCCLIVVNCDLLSTTATTIIVLTKLIGITVSILLLVYEIDKSNAFVKNICTVGGHINCDAVLNSSSAKVFGMSWSEAGFFYFAASYIFMLIAASMPAMPAVVGGFACLAALYIPFSIYYQWKVVRQWCPLCLAVQAVLLIELAWAIIVRLHTSENIVFLITPFLIVAFILSITLPIIFWYAVKNLIKKAKDEQLYQNAYKRLLYNPDVFNGLLEQQKTAPPGWENLGITIGNPMAKNTIVKVCNPYCGPCAKAHTILEEIINYNENINLKIIFTTSNKETDLAVKPVQHLLAIDLMQNNTLTQQALDDWYLAEKKDYQLFAEKYPINDEFTKQKEKIESMKKWCDEAEITHTPTLFLNGKKLPEMYNIVELKYIF